MKTGFIHHTDRRKIAIYESEGNGQHILFIHGNSLGGETFVKQFQSGLGKKYRCVAFDLPGHGNSETPVHPQQAYTPQGLVDAILHIVYETKLLHPVLVGHSLGGHLILQAINRLPDAKAVAIFGTPPLMMPPDPSKVFLPHPNTGNFFMQELTEDEVTRTCAAILAPGAKPDNKLIRLLKKADGNFRAVFAASAFGGSLKDETAILSGLKIPLAIFHGEKEQLINLEYIQSLSIPTLWKKQVQIIKKSGHSPQWENAEEFNKLLEEFLNSTM